MGALTSTSYRFRGRPWEIQNVPDHLRRSAPSAATPTPPSARAGWRACSRATNPAVDDGWLCDKGRYGLATWTSRARITTPLIRGGRGLEAVSTADGARPRRRPAAGDGRAVRPRLGRGARLRRPDQRGGAPVGAHPGAGARRRPDRVRPRGRRRLGRAGRRTRPRSPTWTTPTLIVVAGDTDLGHRAPMLELRIRKAVRPRRARRHRRRRRDPPGHAARRRAHLGRARHRARGAARRATGRRRPDRRLGEAAPCSSGTAA